MLDTWRPVLTRVVVPPLQKVGFAQKSVFTGEAGHPRWREELLLCRDILKGPHRQVEPGWLQAGDLVVGFH